MDKQTGGWTDRQTDSQIDKHRHRQTDVQRGFVLTWFDRWQQRQSHPVSSLGRFILLQSVKRPSDIDMGSNIIRLYSVKTVNKT